MAQTEFERKFPVGKDVLDTLNSISWFLADAMWMLGIHSLAVGFIVPTLVSGLCLLYVEKRLPVTFINLAINCWICMNMFWILSESIGSESSLQYSKIFFVLGFLFILVAAFLSRSLRETFSHFRRFRVLKNLSDK